MNKKIVIIAVACGLFGNVFGMKSLKEKIGKHKESSEVEVNVAIIEAAKAANFERVRELYQKGAAIDARDKEGNTPLHFAAFRDSEPIARFLFEHNASIHAQGGKDRVPLHIAGLIGAAQVGALLLAQEGAEVDCRDADGITPLHMAASQNKIDFMQLLLGHNASLEVNDNNQKSLLHHAVQGGPAVIQFVLDHGAALDARDATQATPLRDAVIQTKVESVRSLIEHRAQVDAHDTNGMSVLHYAVGNEKLVKLLVEGNATVDVLNVNHASPLHRAAQHGSPETLRYLAGKGAAVNRQEVDGFTPLVFAVLAGELENVQTLLDLGADATIRDGFGLTILAKLKTINVIEIKHKRTIKKLLKKAIKNKNK